MIKEILNDDFNDDYDFIKSNDSKSWELLFQQHLFEKRLTLHDYLLNFLIQKQDRPLYCLDLYMQGRRDLCIQSISLNNMDKHFDTDLDCYEFLISYMYSDKSLKDAEQFLRFIEAKIKFLNSRFTNETLTINTNEFIEFQKQCEIFANEI